MTGCEGDRGSKRQGNCRLFVGVKGWIIYGYIIHKIIQGTEGNGWWLKVTGVRRFAGEHINLSQRDRFPGTGKGFCDPVNNENCHGCAQ